MNTVINRRAAFAALALAVALAGCSTSAEPLPEAATSGEDRSEPSRPAAPAIDPPAPAPAPAYDADFTESIFLATMEEISPMPIAGLENTLIDYAYSVCDALDVGVSMDMVFTMALGASGGDETQLEMFGLAVGTGVGAFCPEHLSIIEEF